MHSVSFEEGPQAQDEHGRGQPHYNSFKRETAKAAVGVASSAGICSRTESLQVSNGPPTPPAFSASFPPNIPLEVRPARVNFVPGYRGVEDWMGGDRGIITANPYAPTQTVQPHANSHRKKEHGGIMRNGIPANSPMGA